MDINELLQAVKFQTGSSQEEIRLAEQALAKAKMMQGFIPNLLLIACNPEVPELVRQSAIVDLSIEVKEYWKPKPNHDHQIPEVDREALKENILEALIKCVDYPKI